MKGPRPVAVLAFITVAACSTTDGDGGPATARVDTLASGLIEVANTGQPIWTPETAWRLEEDLRLGTATGDGPEQFGSIYSITSDSRGKIYVLDGTAKEIRVFQPDGTFSHKLGGRGRGPGEIEGAWVLTIGRGDTLTVLDDGLMAFSVFAPDGSFVGRHPRHIVGYGPPRRRHLADESYLDWAPFAPDGRSAGHWLFYPVRYAPGFQRVDTFPPIELWEDRVPSGQTLLHFQNLPVISADAAGTVWFGSSREYRVHRRSLSGDTTLVFTLPAQAVPVGEEDRRAVRLQWEQRPDILVDQLEGLPETKPVLYGIVPDNAGHLLAFVDVQGAPPGTALDVFEEGGMYLGRLTLPTPALLSPGMHEVHITTEHLYVVTHDELDVPYVVRFKINKGS